MDQFPLQMAIGFFGLMVAAWAGLCLYLHATYRRRAEPDVAPVIAEVPEEVSAQAA